MADLKLVKKWKATRWHLEQARQLLPDSVRENGGEIPDYDLGTITALTEFVDNNELELALDQLESLGELNACRGGFWRNLEEAAKLMELNDRAAKLRLKFVGALGPPSAPPPAG